MSEEYNNSLKKYLLATGVFTGGALASAIVAGLSQFNQFIAGYNDQDEEVDYFAIFLAVAAACSLVDAFLVYRLKKLSSEQGIAENNASSIQIGGGEGATERSPLMGDGNQAQSLSGAEKAAWFGLGFFGSAFLALVLSHTALHNSEQKQLSSDDAIARNTVIGGMVSAVAIDLLLGVYLFAKNCTSQQEGSSSCWSSLFSICKRDNEGSQASTAGSHNFSA